MTRIERINADLLLPLIHWPNSCNPCN